MEQHGGMTLERYAQVSAIVTDVINDPAQCAQVLAGEGIRYEDWQAAQAGWTAKMQSMGDFGQTATRYMQLYQHALNARGGRTEVSFDDYIAMRAGASVWGLDQMLKTYQVSQGQWTQIAGHWNNEIGNNMFKYGGVNVQIGAEEMRLRSGGQPRPISMTKSAPNAATATPVASAGDAFGFAGVANSLGNLFGGAKPAAPAPAPAAAPPSAPAGFAAGSDVLVQWSDGNRYPAKVVAAQGDKVHVQFSDGRQLWVDAPYISRP
jgi:hypothetical protein